jgi:branched-chain amino acid transport system ATP-binding protein
MLAIVRTMTNPALLILDEATEQLTTLFREEGWACVAALRANGKTLIIDKLVRRLAALASRHTILKCGRAAWAGTSAELHSDPNIWHRHIGL